MKYIVEDTSLKAIADAVREQTGGVDELSFPDGIVENLNGYSNIDALIEGTISGNYINYNSRQVFSYAFYGLSFLNTVKFINLSATTILSKAFCSCSQLTQADFNAINLLPNVKRGIHSEAFYSCMNLKSLILRFSSIIPLYDSDGLNNSGLVKSDAYIYVPSALIENYKVATNWSTYADQFRALEDYTIDGTTTGDLDPNKI